MPPRSPPAAPPWMIRYSRRSPRPCVRVHRSTAAARRCGSVALRVAVCARAARDYAPATCLVCAPRTRLPCPLHDNCVRTAGGRRRTESDWRRRAHSLSRPMSYSASLRPSLNTRARALRRPSYLRVAVRVRPPASSGCTLRAQLRRSEHTTGWSLVAGACELLTRAVDGRGAAIRRRPECRQPAEPTAA